jgi:hypothetical protein
MQFSFEWQGVDILRIKDGTRDCYMFIDKNGNEIVEYCNHYGFNRLALRELKLKIVLYLKNQWVLPQS